ncbi:hypothetical protein [Brevibacillus laterosporus]|uniref:hypothetical protein n=1 Tax=Brevibacillus laterosporus TaxID=1465 RepID=UPI0003B1DABD|nr:hypothetical protein [Brevibacillus laterosporus]ERM20342.1 hypothetical protein P615_00100 [Brevibacillus laterosporus PE36]
MRKLIVVQNDFKEAHLISNKIATLALKEDWSLEHFKLAIKMLSDQIDWLSIQKP